MNRRFSFALAALTAISLACSQSPSGPAGPSSSDPNVADALPDGSTLKVTAPVLLSPINGAEVQDLDPDLVIQNSSPQHVSSLDLSYVFEVLDSGGQTVYTSPPIPQGSGGQTSHEIGTDLNSDVVHTWRAHAVYQGRQGPMSATASFRTFISGPPGASCAFLGSELAIVACRRTQFGHLSASDRIDYLRRIAFDLNRAGAEHHPYGLLVKTNGNNCSGYSCDIICSNAGFHRQWDVLLDEDEAQIPVWNRIAEARTRPCEIP